MKVAVVSTHPIQYHTPWFQKLAAQEHLSLKVYYALLPDQQQQGVGFGEAFAWDIPMLEGYDWELIPNRRKSPSLRGFYRSSTPAIHSMLREDGPDAVIITGWQSLPLLQALWAAMRLGIPRIVRGESNALRHRPVWVRGLHRMLLSRFNAVLAIGSLNREFYIQNGVPERRIFSCPYFVDNDRFADQFQRDVLERESLREKWNIADGHTCFLFAGKLESKKRIKDLVRAMDVARRSYESIHLLVAGAGEMMEEASGLAECLRVPVTFVGFLNQSEITRAYAAADCLVLPSDSGETWGLVVNEAMACGLPAIVSDKVGCGPDLVEEGVTGSVFPCGDIDALAGKIVELASDPEKLERMGIQAKQRIADYSVDNAVTGTIRAIEFVTKDDRRRMTDDGRRSSVSGLPSPVSGHPSPIARHRSSVLGHPSSVKVLHVIPSLSPKDGGPSFALPLIARGLGGAGIQVDIATTEASGEQLLRIDGVNVLSFQRQSEFYKVSLPLSRWLGRHIRDYDLVHIHALFSYASFRAASLATKQGVPYIVRPLGVLNRWGMQNRRRLLKKFSFRVIERSILRNAAAIQYTSRQEQFEAEEAGVGNNSAVIPLGIDSLAFRALPGAERFYERFPRSAGRDIILFLSRLDPKKGLDLLLRAFSEMLQKRDRGPMTDDGGRATEDGGPPLLVIAGDGDKRFVANLREMSHDLGVSEQVVWTGFLDGDDKLAAMAAASAFVLPSYSENFGVALVEAMAAGLPCVLSDRVGIAADVIEHEAGLVVPCVEGPLAVAMQRLMSEPELRMRLGSNALRLVEDRFSVESMTDSLVKLYDQVLSTRATQWRRTVAHGVGRG